MNNKIFDFGVKQTYKGENRLETLRKFIKDNDIKYIIDVRYNTGNLYQNWNCNEKHLFHLSFELEIYYFHSKELGVPHSIIKLYKNNPSEMKKWYNNHIKEGIRTQYILNQILEYLKDGNIVLICIENLNNPKTPYCHRIWLKEILLKEMEIKNE